MKFIQKHSGIKWSSLVIGVTFLIIGVFILSFPEENLFTVIWLISLLFIINGFIEIFVHRIIKTSNIGFHIITVILDNIAIIFGVILLFNPLMSAILVTLFMSTVFFIIGITYILRALS